MSPQRIIAILIALLIVSIGPIFYPAQIAKAADTQPQHDPSAVVPNQLIVGVEADTTQEQIHALLAGQGLKLIKHWPRFNGALVEVEESNKNESRRARTATSHQESTTQQQLAALETARQSLESLPAVRYAHYNARISSTRFSSTRFSSTRFSSTRFSSTRFSNAMAQQTEEDPIPLFEPQPNDPEYPNQWALRMVRAVEGWNITHGDPDVVVAVIDSGYDFNHPDLAESAIWTNQIEARGLAGVDDDGNGYIDDIRGWDWIDDDNDVANDQSGHGTHVGGTIAAVANNQIGVAGIGRNIKILPLRIFSGPNNDAGLDDLISSLDYAASHEEIQIVNLSLAANQDYPLLADATEVLAQEKLVVAATGNDWTYVGWPAAHPSTIAVAAVDQDDGTPLFSNRGPEVTVAAPGAYTLSTDINNQYTEKPGTSMATPHVSALAAMIASLRPDFSNAQIRSTIVHSAIDTNSADYPGHDDLIGHGRIDNYQALLDASVGLQMTASNPVDEHSFARHPIDYLVQLQAPAAAGQDALPVQNAVLYYTLVSSDGSTISPAISGRMLTDANGYANITFIAPVNAGDYLLQTQVGLAQAEFPLTVHAAKVHTTVTVASPQIRAGNGNTLIRVEARDDAGNLISAPLPLRLSTDLGSFGTHAVDGDDHASDSTRTGPQVLETIMLNGLYTTTLQAGTTTGLATINVTTLGAAPTQTRVQIRSNEAASIELTTDTAELRTDSGEASALFQVLVKDAYGNQVDESYSVKFYSSVGEIAPLLSHAAGDSPLQADLTVPAGTDDQIVIWAILEDSQLLTQYKLDAINERRLFLPFVNSGR